MDSSEMEVPKPKIRITRNPVRLILDTDMGNDIDDALAMAMIHALQSRGECELLGVLSSKDNPYSAVFIDVINTFYGRGHIPVGMVRDGVTPDDRTFIRSVSTAHDGGKLRYPRTHQPDNYEDAVPLLRRLLAGQPDGSVVIVMIGFSTNLAQMLETEPDKISPLDGKALLARKVKRVVAMAGHFADEVLKNPTLESREYNIHTDIPSAMRFFNHCTLPITFCGYEVGVAVPISSDSIESDYSWVEHHPVAEAYRAYMPMPYDRPLWDPAAVLEAVRPGCGNFAYSPPGRVTVDEQGIALFQPESGGPHRYLKVSADAIDSSVREIAALCAQPTASRTKPTLRVT